MKFTDLENGCYYWLLVEHYKFQIGEWTVGRWLSKEDTVDGLFELVGTESWCFIDNVIELGDKVERKDHVKDES